MSLEIVLGPMFSGKTSYVLSYVRKHRAIGRKVLVIKPSIDNRYSSQNVVVSHNNERLSCVSWDTQTPLCEIPVQYRNVYDCFVVEEAQFFNHLKHFCSHILFNWQKHVLVVGLDGDANQQKFGKF